MKSFEMRSAELTRLYPDTLAALEELGTRGTEMGMATNTSREAADYILRNLGLKEFFKVVVTRNDVPRLKPEPEMVSTAIAEMEGSVGWLVGNSRFDAEAARRAGISSIIVRRDGIRLSFSYDYFVSSLNGVASIVFGG
jgi:HAD superfamily hydrolase (TIGR01549 family)